MIVIEPYPGKVRLPIIVPGGPEVEIPAPRPTQGKSSLWKFGLLAGIAGLIYSARGSKIPRLSEAVGQVQRRRGNRLYYMWRRPGGWIENVVSVPKKRLKEYQQRAISTPGALYYVWAESADRARYLLRTDPAAREHKYQRPSWKTGRPPYRKDQQPTLFGALSGRIANCAIWIPREGDDGWTCGAYGRVCDSPTCAAPENPKARQSKVCVEEQSIFSAFYDHMITRCKRYEPTCEGPACMPEPMPYPKVAPEPKVAPAALREPSASEVKSLAQWMAEEYNEQTFGKEPYLAREILSRGGIKPPRRAAIGLDPKKRQAEEYTAIPLFLRNKAGLPMDEMAAELQYEYEDDLRQDIAKAYPPKKTGAWRHQRRKTWEEFEDAAFEQIEEGIDAGTWTGLLAGRLFASIDQIGEEYSMDLENTVKMVLRQRNPFAHYVIPLSPKRSLVTREKPRQGKGYIMITRRGAVVSYDSQGRPRQQKTAEEILARKTPMREEAPEPEQLRLLGQDLFPGLRRELVMEPPEDPATSDDPVTACMERLGWRIPRMELLKSSIAEKMTPDLFTGKTTRLSPGEKDYQRAISECLQSRSGTAGLAGLDGALDLSGDLGARRKLRPQIHWNPQNLTSAINAAIKLAYYEPQYVFATDSGYHIKPKIDPWQNHVKVYPDGRAEEHIRDLRSGTWKVTPWRYASGVPRQVSPMEHRAEATEAEQLRFLGEAADPWMKQTPFTEQDNHDYNRYSHYTADLNKEFSSAIQNKLEEINARMDKYGITEIPPEVETGLEWYRRRTYEYLRRMIYSRNQAPGAAIVGPSNYNWRKHEKVMNADRKYLDKLNQSERKLDTQIRKMIRKLKKGVATSDTEKWEQIAVNTKRTAFGKMVLDDYLANPNNRADQEQNIKALYLRDPKSTFRPVVRKQGRDLHSRLIAAAFEKGIPIAPAVLAQYPDLGPQTIPAMEPAREQELPGKYGHLKAAEVSAYLKTLEGRKPNLAAMAEFIYGMKTKKYKDAVLEDLHQLNYNSWNDFLTRTERGGAWGKPRPFTQEQQRIAPTQLTLFGRAV